eukprot:CAMPEP_0114999578 /NCGR_PEP_ID=MMETSP0216-20121206/16230_1 /TAXON_ID=223996 /ORGANISM="Protocruzia adherens, Strain Boccale" /LENGTH=239 /DNA_ID=CAMNT_0002364481 /DNA_START=86 /DNA_END=802 /DNA_ORIENTATION=-
MAGLSTPIQSTSKETEASPLKYPDVQHVPSLTYSSKTQATRLIYRLYLYICPLGLLSISIGNDAIKDFQDLKDSKLGWIGGLNYVRVMFYILEMYCGWLALERVHIKCAKFASLFSMGIVLSHVAELLLLNDLRSLEFTWVVAWGVFKVVTQLFFAVVVLKYAGDVGKEDFRDEQVVYLEEERGRMLGVVAPCENLYCFSLVFVNEMILIVDLLCFVLMLIACYRRVFAYNEFYEAAFW